MSAHPLAASPLQAIPWAAIDLEMTGLDPVNDRICEIGIVRGRGGRMEERWSVLVDPGIDVETPAQEVHGIQASELRGAPRFIEVMDEVLRRLDGALCLAHSADVDALFLKRAVERAGRRMPQLMWLDTLVLARTVLALPRHRLGHVCAALGVPLRRAHRALEDAEATLAVGRILVGLIDPAGALTLRELEAHLLAQGMDSDWRRAQLQVLAQGMRARESVCLHYLSPEEGGGYRITEREVDLWKVNLPRVQGFCHLRQDARVFRVERIRHVELVGRPYELPAGIRGR